MGLAPCIKDGFLPQASPPDWWRHVYRFQSRNVWCRQDVPIITPGRSGVPGIGASRQSPVIRDGAVVVSKVMTATLSGEHRAVDGAQGAEFPPIFKELIEEPARLIL